MPPRASLRQRTATPARATRANTNVPQDTPTTNARRSTRAASKAPVAAKDAVANPALPGIQTQQSYAYGSSKTPALPEQLHARDTMSMRAVASRLDAAAVEAEENFEAQAAEVREDTPESQIAARETRAQKRSSKELSRPPQNQEPSATPENVRKQTRTAEWVNSSSGLDDIPEEDSRADPTDDEPETPTVPPRESSMPSSFPSGSFNQSYNYERGGREPRLPRPVPLPQVNQTPGLRPRLRPTHQTPKPLHRQSTPLYRKAALTVTQAMQSARTFIAEVCNAVWRWIYRMIQTVQKSVLELPDTPAVSTLIKVMSVGIALSLFGVLFCTVFTWTCDSSSSSVITQNLQLLCGQCQRASVTTPFDLSNTNTSDVKSLIVALRSTQQQINQIEKRLNSRIDSSQASHVADTAMLRQQQDSIELQIRRLNQRNPNTGGSVYGTSNVASPLIPKINFFSPAKGAVVQPFLTSPTLARNTWYHRLLYTYTGIRRTISSVPRTALEPWNDEGDCWCAADHPSTGTDEHDSLRLVVETSQYIYPTELVIEHFPSTASLEPGVAPKDVELWADFANLSFDEWETQRIRDLVAESPERDFLRGIIDPKHVQTWARIGTAMYTISTESSTRMAGVGAEYEMAADEPLSQYRGSGGVVNDEEAGGVPHVQRFNLQVNQNGLLHYSARFMVRVKTNYGASHTCLYRVRLHGLPMDREGLELAR